MQSRQIDLTINKMTKAQYNAITPNADEVYLITDETGCVTSVNNIQPDANGNVTIPTGGTVDQTYNPSSANAQSGVAINGAGFATQSWVGQQGYITSSALSGYVPVSANSQTISATSGDFTINTYYSLIVNDTINDIEPIRYDSTSQQLQLFNSDSYPVVAYFEANIPNNNLILNVEGDFNINTIDSGADVYINSSKVLTASNVDQTYDSTSSNAQSGVAIANAGFLTGITSSDVTTALGYTPYNSSNPSGYITASDLPTNHVTTDTDQNITGVKTFVGQKRIAFKQATSSDKLGFTLYNNSGTEKGYLEYNPSNTVDSVPLMTLGNYATASAGLAHVGFRKYSNISGASGAYNLLAPLISDAKTPFSLTTTYTNFYMPLGFTDGNSTVKTAKSGLVDLSSILPTVNNSTITFTQGGVTKGTITLNQASNSTIALDAGGSGGIQNTATGTDSLTILGTATTNDYSMNIGPYSSVTEDDSIAIGQGASVSGADSLGIGRDCNVSGDNSIQLGNGTLINDDTFQVWNYPLLDYQYGEIFEARIPSTIARTSQIPTVPTNISAFTNDSGYITSSALTGYATQSWVGQQGYITGIGSADVTTALGFTPANDTLSNLGTTASANLDGQWTPLNNQLANNVTWNNTVSEATYDISSYLPDDNYNYEVMISGQATASATQQKFCTIQLKSDIQTSNLYLTSSRTTTTSTINVQNNATIIIPVGPGRYITQYASTSSNASGVYSLWIKGYRRIGTNA